MRKRRENLLENNPEYNIEYNKLLKEARIWNNMGQYWLARKTEIKAEYIVKEEIEEYNKLIIKSEDLLYKTKRL